MLKEKKIVQGPPIIIKGNIKRLDIIKRVVNTFIKTENSIDFKKERVRYPVEYQGGKPIIFAERPGYKKNFDFYVNYEGKIYGITKRKEVETHLEIGMFLQNLTNSEPEVFEECWKIITIVYQCKENDVEKASEGLNQKNIINMIKLIKWMFIMEDILYWGYEGRAFLYNALYYFSRTESKYDIKKYNDPIKLKRDMENIGLSWVNVY